MVQIEAPANSSPQVGRTLADLGPALDTRVVVYWATGLAVQTTWRTFTEYWDDFCYPSSDDVVIWCLSESWALRYHHDEYFEFSAQAVA